MSSSVLHSWHGGSYNLTSRAEKLNYEALTITSNAKLARVMTDQIKSAYEAGTAPEGVNRNRLDFSLPL